MSPLKARTRSRMPLMPIDAEDCIKSSMSQPIPLSSMIKKKQADALIILYTGYELSDYYELLIEKKIDGLLSKLATKEQVIQTIQAAIRGEILLAADFLDFVISSKFRF